MDPQLYGQLTFDKAGKNIQWKKESLQQMVLGKLDSHMQKNETEPFPYTIHKNRFKMDERPKYETGNHQNPRGNTGSYLFHLGHCNFLLDTSLEAGGIKFLKMNYWDFIKIKKIAQQRKQSTKLKGNLQNGRR